MIQVGFISSTDAQGSLSLINDNRENPITFNGELTVENVVKFVLDNLDEVIKARSEVAKALKANQEFKEK